jgi:glycosyltransferase involved in cell wall biosynthesis
MNKFPLISIVIPVYCHTLDHRTYFVEALQSVAVQTYRKMEVIIVDDTSPIDIRPLVARVEMLPEVKIFRNQQNIRHAESRNRGIRAARGELIAFLDHDDVWMPEKLASQLAVLKANEDAAMVFCEVEMIGPQAHRLNFDQGIIPERPDFYWFVTHANYVITLSSVLLRKQALLDIGLFDSRYSTMDDFDAWLKILMHAPIVHQPVKLTKYRLHTYNVNYTIDLLNENKLLTTLIWGYWRSANPMKKLKLLPVLGRKLAARIYYSGKRAGLF